MLKKFFDGDPQNGETSPGQIRNAIFTIVPYRFYGQWVFDDEKVGLDKEAFVGGADTFLDKIVGFDKNECVALFSVNPFPGETYILEKKEGDQYGTTYIANGKDMENHQLWLCPALFLYFPQAPQKLFVQIKK